MKEGEVDIIGKLSKLHEVRINGYNYKELKLFSLLLSIKFVTDEQQVEGNQSSSPSVFYSREEISQWIRGACLYHLINNDCLQVQSVEIILQAMELQQSTFSCEFVPDIFPLAL